MPFYGEGKGGNMKIDNEFKGLIPPLTAEEYSGLEKSLLEEGCRDALIVWEDTLIDGHNRYEICQHHGIPFETSEKVFDSREAAMLWIIDNQFSRRNLPAYDRGVLALKKKDILIRQAKLKQGQRTDLSDIPQTFGECNKKNNETNVKVGKEAGLSHETIRKIEKIENKAPDEIKQKIRREELSINRAYKDIKREEVKQQAQVIKKPSGKYRIIYADPPWKYGNMQETGNAEYHYPAMTISELCELSIKELAEDDAVLFMWVTSPLLEECFAVIKAWGFKYKSSFIWDKVKHNMGYYNSVRHELLLVCTRGSCLPDNNKLYDSVVSVERSNNHSEKPEEFRNIIDDLYREGKRIELFARKKNEGWDTWGNEA